MASRTWIKIYCDKWLTGTLREETPELRGIWADLLALAGSGEYGDTGQISLKNGVGFTDLQFEKLLNLTQFQWRKSKNRLLLTDRITINGANVLTIINWKKYQSEYERQKPYRNQKLQSEVTTQSNTGDRDRDRDIREEEKIEIENNTFSSENKDRISELLTAEKISDEDARWLGGLSVEIADSGGLNLQNLYRVLRVVRGDEQVSAAVKRRYLETLARLGIGAKVTV